MIAIRILSYVDCYNGVGALKEKLASDDTSDKTRSEVKYLLSHADSHFADSGSCAECWKWSDLKWYSGDTEYYPEVDFTEKLMLDLGEEHYRFIRIGEDSDDLEVQGYFLMIPLD